MFHKETTPDLGTWDSRHDVAPADLDIDELYKWLDRPVTEDEEYKTD